ncbi:unnamed protein product [Phyllotreta striolata]|uniref:Uncharacterized protein n=1 Tax=Phyllotreta striolata TaxID=444603 RepID=A0A9N9TIG3_PHYSR|nr:unnamed protein product [Phyllotreta striolata]
MRQATNSVIALALLVVSARAQNYPNFPRPNSFPIVDSSVSLDAGKFFDKTLGEEQQREHHFRGFAAQHKKIEQENFHGDVIGQENFHRGRAGIEQEIFHGGHAGIEQEIFHGGHKTFEQENFHGGHEAVGQENFHDGHEAVEQENFHGGHTPIEQYPAEEKSQSFDDYEQTIEREWNKFMTQYNKVYADDEERRFRREAFIENRARISRLNADYAEGKRNYVHKMNPYGDLLLHEFNVRFCGFNRSRTTPTAKLQRQSAFLPSANVVFPTSVDWREVGAVTSVKNQLLCSGCWAFAAAGALEGHHFRKTGDLVDVSAQNLIDCTQRYGNNGCDGGLMDPAFEYVRDNDGVDSEESYPFEGKTDVCRFKREDVVATCTGFVEIPANDEKSLEIALATLGPVTAAIDATKETFQFYSGGIYDDPECANAPEQLNHAVLIVGYGTEPDGRKYWLVKNSYGPQWGIGGYIKIAKENNNQCGIAVKASYPLV